MKMWGGRFKKEPDPCFMEFSSSLAFDARLFPYDIRCTKAWADAMRDAGVITDAEAREMESALGSIEGEFTAGTFEFQAGDEDIHTAIERRLVELVGPSGGKVRTGRSRNDSVATDMRLFVMESCTRIEVLIRDLQRALVGKAREYAELVVPGHTHLQPAQPVPIAHLLLAFVYMLERDKRRFENAALCADVMPLGSGAIAGTSINIDREKLARLLGFSRISENSVDAVSDRDFACDELYAISMTMVHLSRLAEQIVLWSSEEFGLAFLDDAWATGSSLMPQKKNPDGPELVRGKAGRTLGDLVAMMTVLKGLPLAYNRDLQEDKEPLFDATLTLAGSLRVLEGTIDTIRFDGSKAQERLNAGYLAATELADFLVEKGVPFPEAHMIVGRIVAACLDNGRPLKEITVDELREFSELFDEDAVERVSVESFLERHGARGGVSRESVQMQIEEVELLTSDG